MEATRGNGGEVPAFQAQSAALRPSPLSVRRKTMYRRITILVLMILGACRSMSADCTLPSDFCGQLSSWVFRGAPAHFTGANVALFTPKRVLAVRKNEKGRDEKREFCGLLVEWTPYGDVGERDDEKGVLIAMKIVGEVYLFDEGKLVGVELESSVEWVDGKPTASGVKVWLERDRPNKRPEGTEGKCPPSKHRQPPSVPHP